MSNLGCVAVVVLVAVALALGCGENPTHKTQVYAYEMSFWFAGNPPYQEEDLEELLAIQPPSRLASAHQALYEAVAAWLSAREPVVRFEKQSYDRFWEDMLAGTRIEESIQTCGNRPFVRLPHQFERACIEYNLAERAYARAEGGWTEAMAEACGVSRVTVGFVDIQCRHE